MENMINIWVVLSLLAAHWIADFIFQTDKQAKGKSKNVMLLLDHTKVYSVAMGLVFFIIVNIKDSFTNNHAFQWLLFTVITFACHTIQDYITSRINARLWEQKRVHAFFVSVGFDQLLHFIQLLLTYQLLTNNF